MNYDIFICAGPKDYCKLPYSIETMFRYVRGFDAIYLVTSTPIKPLPFDRINYLVEDDVFAVEKKWRFRPNWIYQQFLKLFQDVTKHDYYATIDADVFFNKPFSFVAEDGRPVWYLGADQYHKPYFEFQKKVFGFDRIYPHSFINDMNFFSKTIVREMLSRHGYTLESFLAKSYRIIDARCMIGEPELYGNYVTKYRDGLYAIRHMKTAMIGREQTDLFEPWDDASLRSEIRRFEQTDNDVFMIHSWHVKEKKHKKLLRVLKRLLSALADRLTPVHSGEGP